MSSKQKRNSRKRKQSDEFNRNVKFKLEEKIDNLETKIHESDINQHNAWIYSEKLIDYINKLARKLTEYN